MTPPQKPLTLVENLEQIRKLVVEPIVNEMKAELNAVRRELVTQGERFERAHQQLERAMEQTDALIRSSADPITGMMTRPELTILREIAENDRALIKQQMRDHVEKIGKQIEENYDDHEARLRLIERNAIPSWAWPGITAIVSAFVAYATHIVWK